MKFTQEDIKLVEKFIDIKNRGFYADGKQLTDVYNRVLEKNLNPTNCGSCLRQRTNELENALNSYKAKLKAQENENDNVSPSGESKTIVEENKPIAKKVGRPKK